MDTAQFDQVVKASRARQDKLLTVKGADYTRKSPDRLNNFKRMSGEVGVSPFQVWAVYAGKHWDALMTFIQTGRTESEAVEGRLDDLHNYLYLLEGLLAEVEERLDTDARFNHGGGS